MILVLIGGKIKIASGFLDKSAVLITGDKITWIGHLSDLNIPADCRIIDMSGRTLTSPEHNDLLTAGNPADIVVLNANDDIEIIITSGKIFPHIE